MKFKPGSAVKINPTCRPVGALVGVDKTYHSIIPTVACAFKGYKGKLEIRSMTLSSVATIVKESDKLPGYYEILFENALCLIDGKHIELAPD